MSRSIKIADLPTTTPNKFIEIKVHYNQGGMNYFSGSSTPRGYRLSVTPVTLEDSGRSFLLFSGVAHTIETTNRFNAKWLESLAAQGDKLPKYKESLAYVLAKENLTLATVTI